MNRIVLFGVILAGLACSGCQATYTSIHQVEPNRYYVTRTKQGFFKTYGTLYECQAQSPNAMSCREVSDL